MLISTEMRLNRPLRAGAAPGVHPIPPDGLSPRQQPPAHGLPRCAAAQHRTLERKGRVGNADAAHENVWGGGSDMFKWHIRLLLEFNDPGGGVVLLVGSPLPLSHLAPMCPAEGR